jgi:hypothetical protein
MLTSLVVVVFDGDPGGMVDRAESRLAIRVGAAESQSGYVAGDFRAPVFYPIDGG